ncbi:MAG: UDP-N-acetylmuramoyl-tripeptide--D-alanyl-D-alanine ligase, partial [Verrucomicrobiales bacterium]|nr:UDP-N-acetylmuramoyl-tripeptide--D-alanyl-D-alanine ligase [Verrucomicrobiales bacterium]
EPRTLQYIAEACQGDLKVATPERTVSRICTDSRQAQAGDLFFALSGERFDAHEYLPQVIEMGVAAIVVEQKKMESPNRAGSLPSSIVVDDTRKALGRLGSRYRRDFDLPIVAVAGSNGKTTTKELIASVLRQKKPTLWSESSFNNEVGVPLTLLKLEKVHQAAVLELGTNHPGELAPLAFMVAPRYAVITNIGREHLEFFHDLDGVAREEGAVAEAVPAGGVVFLNGDNIWTDAIARRTCARVVKVGLNEKNDYCARDLKLSENGVSFSVKSRSGKIDGEYRLKLLGRHQVMNALFAIAVGDELGLSRAEIARGVSECASPKMRMQFWSAKGVGVLDDAYNANADSMLAALDTLREMPVRNRRVAVLGDMAELGDEAVAAHVEVGEKAASLKIDQLFAVGRLASGIAAAARKNGLKNVAEFTDVQEAANQIQEFVREGDLVLVKASRSMKMERIVEQLIRN